eukprot:scaffold18137_cov127-Skeletonema_marinoi.AAC.2
MGTYWETLLFFACLGNRWEGVGTLVGNAPIPTNLPQNSFQCMLRIITFNIFPSSRPMRTMSDVLESPREALSNRHIIRLNGRFLTIGQAKKGVTL